VADIVSVELDAQEVDWEFASGLSISGFAFNGQVPGPTIEANVGDTVEVRLTNKLPEATIVHWHCIRLQASMDGTGAVQRPVERDETFTYSFIVPDAGTFWYHSHHNETEQIERGLYGPLIVRGPDEPKLDRERILFLDDLKLDAEGKLSPFGDSHEHHAGREGDVRLLNGSQEPELEIAGGQVERWRIVNAANTRFMRLSIGGRPFSILGSDGGLIGSAIEATEVLVTPGERVELAVGPFAEGDVLELEALPYDRGRGEPSRDRFATIRVGPAKPSSARVPDILRTIQPLAAANVATTRTVSMKALMHGGHGQRDDDVRVGELQVWDLVNETSQDHPFHLHGFFFQVLSDGAIAWKDTVNVPRKEQVRIAWLADDRPGEWMYHCHILEHHAMGMMAHFSVVA
jgi:FtsP/CotA-like multicopper oxidase with cupredoxin domain